mmetsp:Transcript_40728/g.93690  ORF Transcript_40728/g.93690 Transcript_40728/m.93690 type:complete len:1443 (-) Transcript_40728:42-4370(-)
MTEVVEDLAADSNTEAAFNDFPVQFLPPEGVDWANRWAELENGMEAAEAERDSLKEEVMHLRKQRYDQAIASVAPAQSFADSAELKEAQGKVEELQNLVEKRLTELVEERSRNATLSEEVQKLTADLTQVRRTRLALDQEVGQLKSELMPTRQEAERLKLDKAQADQQLSELRTELQDLTADRNKIFREKSEQVKHLQAELDQLRAEVQFQRETAEEAREFQNKARADVMEAQEELRKKTLSHAEAVASLEKKLDLKAEQLKRAEDLREAAQQKQEVAVKNLQVAVSAKEAAEASSVEAAKEVEELQKSLAKNEELLRKQVPGAEEESAPEGFSSVAELVHEVTGSREDLVRLKQEKQQLQDLLADVEREVRARYPALVAQRLELEKLQTVSGELTRHNEGLLEQVQVLETQKKESDVRAMQAQRAVEILENHARDMGKQLAGVVYENRRLSSRERGAAPASGETLRDVQDLAEQNESLRKTVALLRRDCETAAQKELVGLREEHDKLSAHHNAVVEETNEQIAALQKVEERLTRERDEAREALRDAKQKKTDMAEKPATSSAEGGQVAPAQHLQALREEFTKVNNTLQQEAKQLREADHKLRSELTTLRAQLDFEKSAKHDEEMRGTQLAARLEEQKARYATLDKRFVGAEETLRREEAAGREAEANLKLVSREKSQRELDLKVATSRAQELEEKCSKLLAERAAHSQLQIELQASLAAQRDAYKDMKSTLEAAYKSEEQLVKEQLQQAQGREKSMQRTVEELTKVRNECQADASAARARSEELEASNAKLNSDLRQKNIELDELRATGAAKARRSEEVSAEAEAQLTRSQAARGESADVEKLRAEILRLEERAREHDRNAKMWKTMLQNHEDDLKSRHAEKDEMQKEFQLLQEKQEKHEAELAECHERELKLQRDLNGLTTEASSLRVELDKKESDIERARLEGEQKAHEAKSKLEAYESEKAGARGDNDDWQRRYQEAVKAHGSDIERVDKLRQQNESIDAELRNLKHTNLELAAANDRMKLAQDAGQKDMRSKLEQAETHNKLLREEVERYQSHMKALTVSVEDDPSAAMQEVAATLKQAQEQGELSRRELELDKDRLDRDNKALKMEISELQSRLLQEQQEVQKLAVQVKRDKKVAAELGALKFLEEENKRFTAELQASERRLTEKEKEATPKETELKELRGKEKSWQRDRSKMTARIQELESQMSQLRNKEKVVTPVASGPASVPVTPAEGKATSNPAVPAARLVPAAAVSSSAPPAAAVAQVSKPAPPAAAAPQASKPAPPAAAPQVSKPAAPATQMSKPAPAAAVASPQVSKPAPPAAAPAAQVSKPAPPAAAPAAQVSKPAPPAEAPKPAPPVAVPAKAAEAAKPVPPVVAAAKAAANNTAPAQEVAQKQAPAVKRKPTGGPGSEPSDKQPRIGSAVGSEASDKLARASSIRK